MQALGMVETHSLVGPIEVPSAMVRETSVIPRPRTEVEGILPTIG